MFKDKNLTGLRPSTILLAAVSLSIGWGIRGNFGHEYGAMIPGALTGIAVCLMSGRADWRARVAYFGFFGAVGWGFGGSMSYGEVIGFSHAGQAATQYFGFFSLFVIGFLWGGLGGAATAFPGVAAYDRMTALFRPIIWVFAFWCLEYVVEYGIAEYGGHLSMALRQENPLYWLDADWVPASFALMGVCAFDLWDRRLGGMGALILLVLAGAAAGWLLQAVCDLTHLSSVIAWIFVWPQGDLSKLPEIAQAQGKSVDEIAASLVNNWPLFLKHSPQHTGWIFGAVLGAIAYFRRWGRFGSGASLLAYMSGGWLLCFLLVPVLLGFGGAGLRMTPPRSDDWAGILGVYLGTLIWLRRNNLVPVIYASLITASIGGIGFSGAICWKLLWMSFGNPVLPQYADPTPFWTHWQQANWHSVMEQSYGFINGIGVAIAMGLLARRKGLVEPGHVARRWTEIFAVAFVLFGVGWLNIYKNVDEWVSGPAKAVPAVLEAPLFDFVKLSADAWFAIVFVAIALCVVSLMHRHERHPIAVIPDTTVGKAQMFYLVFLWVMVIANFERAMPHFESGRLITEWVILLNAVFATWLILALPTNVEVWVAELGLMDYDRGMKHVRWGMVAAVLVGSVAFPALVRWRYDGRSVSHYKNESKDDLRFGPDATWRMHPTQMGLEHK